MSAPTDPYELLKLQPGWDSYDGAVPTQRTVDLAASIGDRLRDLFSNPAYYVPCSDGSVQVEWHTDGWDVEVCISPFSGETG